jgi:phenylacetate-CoA ligase
VGGILGRVDDMLTVRGVNLYPAQVEDIVRRYPDVLEFQISHRRERHMDEVTLVLEVEAGRYAVLDVLSAELRKLLGVRVDCRAVDPGTLPRGELKSRRVVRH